MEVVHPELSVKRDVMDDNVFSIPSEEWKKG